MNLNYSILFLILQLFYVYGAFHPKNERIQKKYSKTIFSRNRPPAAVEEADNALNSNESDSLYVPTVSVTTLAQEDTTISPTTEKDETTYDLKIKSVSNDDVQIPVAVVYDAEPASKQYTNSDQLRMPNGRIGRKIKKRKLLKKALVFEDNETNKPAETSNTQVPSLAEITFETTERSIITSIKPFYVETTTEYVRLQSGISDYERKKARRGQRRHQNYKKENNEEQPTSKPVRRVYENLSRSSTTASPTTFTVQYKPRDSFYRFSSTQAQDKYETPLSTLPPITIRTSPKPVERRPEPLQTISSRPEKWENSAKNLRKKDPVVPIVDSENYLLSHGEYHYSFEGGDGTKAFSRGELRHFDEKKMGEAVVGGFSYKDKNGEDVSITYTADENGYRPTGAHLPTPPPIPPAIARALAYLATKPNAEPVTEIYVKPKARGSSKVKNF